MGQELPCRVRFGGRSGAGKAYLESRELRFRGDFAMKIALADVRTVKTDGGDLVIDGPNGEARFTLGDAAALWANKILNPKPLIDKLGVKPGARVYVLGVDDAKFQAELAGRAVTMLAKPNKEATDLIFLAVDDESSMRHLERLRPMLATGGAIWVVSRKGKAATVKDTEVIAAGRRAKLVDTKVVAFSETHTALRFSLPKTERRG